MIGVLGGFTTFSAFTIDVLDLFQNDQYLISVIYILWISYNFIIGCLFRILDYKNNKFMNDFDIYSISQEYSNVRLDRWIKIIYPSFRQNDIEVALRKRKIKVNQKKIKSNYRIPIG